MAILLLVFNLLPLPPDTGVTCSGHALNACLTVVAPKRWGGGTNGILAFNALLA